MQNQLIHHSALSFRKLRAMKIKDRSSFHVIILNADLATPESLSSQQLFGQFGAIASIRILKDTSPREAHIRFANEDAAAQAIEWCNNQSPLFVNAKYGYQKYCVKFINNQPCDIPGCAMRHSWSDTRDILNFRSLTPAGIDPLCPTASSESQRTFLEEKAQMMQKIAMLMQRCHEQAKRIALVNQRMQMAQQQNAALKKEAQRLAQMGMAQGMNMTMNPMMMNQMGMNQMQMHQMTQMSQMNSMVNPQGMKMQSWQQYQQQQRMYQQQQQMQQQQQLTSLQTCTTNTPCSSVRDSSTSSSDMVSPTPSRSSWEDDVDDIVDEAIKACGDLNVN